MPATNNGRQVFSNATVDSQADFFQADGFTRVTGIALNLITVVVFFNNVAQPWPLVNGLPVTDIQCASGLVYFNEIQGSPGYYSVRFRPNAVGFWRVILTYPTGTPPQIQSQNYDVVSHEFFEAGLNASFIRPDR